MSDTIFKLDNLTKTYIMGTKKNAHKAQKEIQKLYHVFEHASSKGDKQTVKDTAAKLKKAQRLFSDERYEESYTFLTGKKLKKRRKDRGAVIHALNGINLEIKKGELIAIMGPSGSGKSTLLNMLGLLDQPTAGQISIKGRNVAAIKNREIPEIHSQDIGFVFQSFNLIPTLTAIENVMLPLRYARVSLKKRKKIAKDALDKVGLGDRINHTPNELSGGQRQRVAIARSIVNNPLVVFGDELTGELDSKTTDEVMDLVVDLNKKHGQTFIIVTHNPDVAKIARRIILMKDGAIEKDTVA